MVLNELEKLLGATVQWSMSRERDCERTIETAERLPDSGLGRVAGGLVSVGRGSAALSTWLARPHDRVRPRVLVWVT